jgi:hypothetical protein
LVKATSLFYIFSIHKENKIFHSFYKGRGLKMPKVHTSNPNDQTAANRANESEEAADEKP